MQLHNLENTPIEEITACFNKAFETYFVPINLTEQQLLDKIKLENIQLNHSVGITIDGQLAGFILIGINLQRKIAYNAGTGVISAFRGQKLTEKMYSRLLPDLKKMGIHIHLLEVICENKPALKIYQNLGYFVTRKVICYKGKIIDPVHLGFKIETIPLPSESQVKHLWSHYPAYQNSMQCIKNIPEKHTSFGLFEDQNLIGYIIFDKLTLRIKQFGVDAAFRNEGIGHQLFYQVQKQFPEKEIVLINIDEDDFEANDFLKNIGFKAFIEQYEMELNHS
ncbi:MAG: GNAT family N-acetyltransferase [Flavobacterium sp.]